MRIIQSEYPELPEDVFKYQMYPVSTKYTQEWFRKWNLKYNGRASIAYEPRLKRVVLKGKPEEKERLKNKLISTYSNFMARLTTVLNQIHVATGPRLSDVRDFYVNRKEAEELAENFGLGVRLSATDNKQLEIIYHSVNDNVRGQTIQEAKLRAEKEVESLKIALVNLLKVTLPPEISERCGICENLFENRYRLLCKHTYCKECLRGMILASEGHLKCPAEGCSKEVALIDIINNLQQEELKEIYVKQTPAFLLQNKDRFKACPSPGCDNILINPRTQKIKPKIDRFLEDSEVIEEEIQASAEGMVEEGGKGGFNPFEESDKEEESEVGFTDPVKERTKEDANQVFCECCGHDYCFDCLETHYNQTCEEYQQKQVSSPYSGHRESKGSRYRIR